MQQPDRCSENLGYKISRPCRFSQRETASDTLREAEDDMANPFLKTKSLFKKKKASVPKSELTASPHKKLGQEEREPMQAPRQTKWKIQHKNIEHQQLYPLKTQPQPDNSVFSKGVQEAGNKQIIGVSLNDVSFFNSLGKNNNQMIAIDKWFLRMGTEPYEFQEPCVSDNAKSVYVPQEDKSPIQQVFGQYSPAKKTVTQFYLDLNSLGVYTQEEPSHVNQTNSVSNKNYPVREASTQRQQQRRKLSGQRTTPLVETIYKLSDRLLELHPDQIIQLENQLCESPILENLHKLSNLVQVQPDQQKRIQPPLQQRRQYQPNLGTESQKRSNLVKQCRFYDQVGGKMVDIEVRKLSREKLRESLQKYKNTTNKKKGYSEYSRDTKKKTRKGELVSYSSKIKASVRL